MTNDLSNPRVRKALIKFTETGARSNCPFCIGRMITSVAPGERIILLQGMHAGRCATVSDHPGWSDDEFLVQFDAVEKGTLTRIGYQRDRFTILPLGAIPDWLCHLAMDDLSAVDEACLETAINFADTKGSTNWADLLTPIILTIRSRRLPVSSRDIWLTLAAHGFGRNNRKKFKEYFDFGLRLLVLFNGRPPVQRRKMDPMSRGRYLTPGHEEWSGPSPKLTF
jgi:hypothetical protein